MSEQEPVPFCQLGMLRVEALHKTDKCTRADVCGEHGGRVLATERVFRIVFNRTGEEAAM